MEHPGGKPEVEKDKLPVVEKDRPPVVEKERPPVAEDTPPEVAEHSPPEEVAEHNHPEEVAEENSLEEVAEDSRPEEAGQQSPLDYVGSILVAEGMVLNRTHGNQVMKDLIQVYINMATELKTQPHLLQYDEEKFNTTDYWTSTMDIHEHKKNVPKISSSHISGSLFCSHLVCEHDSVCLYTL